MCLQCNCLFGETETEADKQIFEGSYIGLSKEDTKSDAPNPLIPELVPNCPQRLQAAEAAIRFQYNSSSQALEKSTKFPNSVLVIFFTTKQITHTIQ